MSEIFKRYCEHTASYQLEIECSMSGPLNAKIAIIGEHPGENEIAFNRPFVGAAGKHLWNALRRYNILQPYVYVTNVIKRRVTPKTAVGQHEFSLWQESLQWELSQLHNLEVIVCLGNAAMQAILGHTGVTQHRGSVYRYNDIPVLVANNPSMIIRKPETEIVFLHDMEKLQRVIIGDYREHRVTTHINPTYDEAMNYIEALRTTHKRFATDIEVIAHETACIGLAHDAYNAMCINFRDANTHRFTVEQEYYILRALAKTFDDPTTTVIAQNGNFDSYFMGYKDHFTFRVDFDTLLAHHTLYPRLPHNLGFLTSQYTDHPYYKDEKDLYKEGGEIESFWRYNGTDCGITWEVARKEEEELKQQGLYDFFINHVMKMQPYLSQATVDGERVDLTIRDRLAQELRDDLQVILNEFNVAVQIATGRDNYTVNPASPKQMCALLFDVLDCKSTRRSADHDVREAIAKDPRTPYEVKDLISKVNRFMEESKFLSTYVNYKIDPDGRFRSEYKQYGVSSAPGRLSSSQTLWGSGGNAQNQPKRAYEMFIADEGCVHIYFDLAQAEARYVGWDANIEHWIEDFERARMDGDFDAHRSLASKMFNIPYEDVPKEDEDEDGNHTIRWTAKRCRHGLNYRMHIATLAQATGLSYGQAAQNYFAYHKTNPELMQWWRAVEREVRKTRCLYNSFGRRLFISERLDSDNALNAIVAFRPQSTIGDKCQKVWYQCHEDDKWDLRKMRIKRNVHDALWGQATPDKAMDALCIMKRYAEEPIMVNSIMTRKVRQLIIPADCKISTPDEHGLHRMSNMSKVVFT